MKRLITASLTLILVLAQLLTPAPAKAAASLYFSGNGVVTIGQTWSVSVLVSTNQPVNAVDLFVTFPAALLQVNSINGSGSNFPTDGPGSPAIDNGAGKVQIIRYALGGYNGGAGKVATLVFKAKNSGNATLGFGVSKVIAHDGNGTNVYSGGGSATLTINAPVANPTPTPNQPSQSHSTNPTPTPATASNPGAANPAISSTTHPDQNAWYKDSQVKLSWTNPSGQASGYNVEVNRDAGSQLAEKISQTQATYDHKLAGDGQWYAHVRTQYATGKWSQTSHYRLQLDTQAPAQPTIKIKPDTDIKVRPEISFSATDAGSSIAKYQLQLDDGQWQDVTSPYKPKTITTGDHTVRLKAIDQAGNSAEASLQFTIAPVETPTIIKPDQTILALGSSFRVSGTSSPGYNIEIYINGQLLETVQTDSQGQYSGSTDYFRPDQYRISVRAISNDGITSQMSAEKTVAINGLVVMGITLPNWLTYLVLIGVLLALLGVIAYLVIRLRQLKNRTSTNTTNQLEGQLEDLEKALDSSIDQTVAALNPQAADQIKQQLSQHIDRLEQAIAPQDDQSKPDQSPQSATAKVATSLKALPNQLKSKLTKLRPKPSAKKSKDKQSSEDKSAVDPTTQPPLPPSPSSNPPAPPTPAPNPTVTPTPPPSVTQTQVGVTNQVQPPASSLPTPAVAPPPPPQPVSVSAPTDAFDAVIAAEKQDS